MFRVLGMLVIWVGKCAPIYKVFIYQDNYFPNKSQKQGNKKIKFVLITKIPKRYLVSQDEDAITVDIELGKMVKIWDNQVIKKYQNQE